MLTRIANLKIMKWAGSCLQLCKWCSGTPKRCVCVCKEREVCHLAHVNGKHKISVTCKWTCWHLTASNCVQLVAYPPKSWSDFEILWRDSRGNSSDSHSLAKPVHFSYCAVIISRWDKNRDISEGILLYIHNINLQKILLRWFVHVTWMRDERREDT